MAKCTLDEMTLVTIYCRVCPGSGYIEDLLREVREVIEARTLKEAAKLIEYWNYDSVQECIRAVRKIRRLAKQMEKKGR